jgi:hypothetical protein
MGPQHIVDRIGVADSCDIFLSQITNGPHDRVCLPYHCEAAPEAISMSSAVMRLDFHNTIP